MKIWLLLFLCAIFSLNYFIISLINEWETTTFNRWDTLRRKWVRARRHRQCWLKRYEDIIPNAKSHPAYLQLWDCEIGAEAILNINIGSSLEVSYHDWIEQNEVHVV